MKTHFKVDTGADGNLLPLAEIFKHFTNANMNELSRTIERHTKLYAYNQTEIKQLGVCELLVEYQSKCKICEFYVVDFPTAILSRHDLESLKLFTVHFNSVKNEMSQASDNSNGSTPMYVNAIHSDANYEFSIKIKHDYSDLFSAYVLFDIPIIAWKTVASDLFVFNDKSYLMIIDLFSWFPVVRSLYNVTTKAILNCLKLVFSDWDP